MRLNLISCEIFYREMCAVIERSPNRIDVDFLPKGLHDVGCKKMLEQLQNRLDRVREEDCDAVVFGYGLCNNGLVGLAARSIPLVVPRAHDCITLFFGSKERYAEYFASHPGVYFKTTGWIERANNSEEFSQLSIQNQMGMDRSYADLVEKYGEDNAKFLYEALQGNEKNYGQYTFIEMGVEPDGRFEKETRDQAEERGWKFEKVKGDLSMIQRLVDGNWVEEEFLVVPPGHRIVAKYDRGIVACEPISSGD